MSQLDLETFHQLRKFVHDKCGIALRDDKMMLVSARLSSRMRQLGLASYRDYLDRVQRDESGGELTTMLNAISTNVTSFFREAEHFDFLGKTFVKWREAGQRRFRFWCAASSSGEEPYTILMTLLANGARDVDLRLLATDISTRALEAAVKGTYPEPAVTNVPPEYRKKFMDARSTRGGTQYQMKREVRDKVLFRQMNLKDMPFPLKGPLDMVLCRNVMIYFDTTMRAALVRDFYRLLKPGGYLLISHTESLVGISDRFRMVSPSIYLKEG